MEIRKRDASGHLMPLSPAFPNGLTENEKIIHLGNQLVKERLERVKLVSQMREVMRRLDELEG